MCVRVCVWSYKVWVSPDYTLAISQETKCVDLFSGLVI